MKSDMKSFGCNFPSSVADAETDVLLSGMERADVNLDKLEKKVESSAVKAKRIKDRAVSGSSCLCGDHV